MQQLGYKEEQLKVVAEAIRGREVFLTGFSGIEELVLYLAPVLYRAVANGPAGPVLAGPVFTYVFCCKNHQFCCVASFTRC